MALGNNYANILYFSNREINRSNFKKWISRCNTLKEYSNFPLFQLCEFPSDSYNFKTLHYFIENLDIATLASLIVIIDYLPLYNENDVYRENSAKKIRELIVEYPEVKFVFDNCQNEAAYKQKLYLKFLGLDTAIIGRLQKENSPKEDKQEEEEFDIKRFKVTEDSIHNLCLKEKLSDNREELKLLIDGTNNLFDASNIRTAIKTYFFQDKTNCLDVRLNYGKVLERRSKNLAYCIEEEMTQALFNSYAMYANGFRVKPITTCLELYKINEKLKSENGYCVPSIVIRDYDLQFEDKPEDKDEIFENCDNTKHQAIHYIRGCHLYGDDDKPTAEDILLVDSSPYWSEICKRNVPVYFISQLSLYPKLLPPPLLSKVKCGFDVNGKDGIAVFGIQKPINGVYDFRKIDEVRDNAFESSYSETIPFKTKRIKKDKKINDSGGHSASPFIYHIAKSLITRAKRYYEANNYIYAAVLSREALEVLNGFHKSLMWEAVHLHAVSENALIMSQVGCEDKKLAVNLELRLSNIKKEVERISGDNKDANRNVLLQIFSDIRSFCRKREHFECADVALKRMVHELHKIKTFNYSVYEAENMDKKISSEPSNKWKTIIRLSIGIINIVAMLGLVYFNPNNICLSHIGGLLGVVGCYLIIRELVRLAHKKQEDNSNKTPTILDKIKSKTHKVYKLMGDKLRSNNISNKRFPIILITSILAFILVLYPVLFMKCGLTIKIANLLLLHIIAIYILFISYSHYRDNIKFCVSKYWKETLYHLKHFFWPITCLLILFASVCMINIFCDNNQNKFLLYFFSVISYSSMAAIIILLICKPMYVVYGLVTTRGSLMKFIAMLILVMGIFSGIYYCGFFHNAGITNNADAPQIAYNIFDERPLDILRTKKGITIDGDLIKLDHTVDTCILYKIEGENHGLIEKGKFRTYKKTTPLFVFSNTIETTLEQGVPDFFNHVMSDQKKCNKVRKQLFRAIVLFHILISWIFLGVFISMLYQKFRNE